METSQVEDQVTAALQAAKKLGKTARSYVNASRLHPEILRRLIFVVMGQSRDHDLMEEADVDRKRFDWILGRCDIIVEPLGRGSSDDLRDLIIEVWKQTNGRDVLGGNPAKHPEAVLRELFAPFYGREEELWQSIQK
jgi:hypothetical protein